jgi:DNA-binding NarL/FixJ family response regulator
VGGNGSTTLIVGPDNNSRATLSKLLERAGFPAIHAATGEDALEAARFEQPWLVLLDVCLSGLSGYEVCRELRDEFGDDLSIVFLSGKRTDPIDRTAGLLVGGDDYIVEPFDPSELLARVRRLDARRRARSNGGSAKDGSLEPPRAATLTQREGEVLRQLAAGGRTREIAAALKITEKTVATHLQHVLAKLGVNTRAQAVALAYRNGLVATNGADERMSA